MVRQGPLKFWRGSSVKKLALQLCHLGVDVTGRSENSYLLRDFFYIVETLKVAERTNKTLPIRKLKPRVLALM